MAAGRGRVDAGEYARRVNAAAEQLESGVPVAEAARLLAERFGCSVRQARRYVERAGEAGRTVAPEATVRSLTRSLAPSTSSLSLTDSTL